MPGTAPYSYTGRVLVAVAIVALAWLLWRLLDVVILVFGALLVATALRTLAAPLRRYVHLPPRLALAVVVLLLIALLVVGSLSVGDPLAEQFAALREVLPRALDSAMRWLQGNPFGSTLLEVWEGAKADGIPWARVAGVATLTFGALGSALLMVFTGIYFAADPALYRRGTLHLVPHEQRGRVDDAMQAAGQGLARWLLGQSMSMLAIGTLTAGGLWLLGVPLAFTLGVIAGVLAFVPFFGAIASGVLIVMVAFTQAPEQALYALVLVVAVQQAEEFLILPFVHRWSVKMPPALSLVAVIIFSLLFGVPGALFATPLMVVVMILVQKLYVQAVVEDSPAPPAPAAQRKVAR